MESGGRLPVPIVGKGVKIHLAFPVYGVLESQVDEMFVAACRAGW